MSEQSMGAAISKRKQAEQVLAEILERMEWPAKLDVKDSEDGGISVALHSEVEVAGIQPGKRSSLIDSLQLVVNKIVNRQPAERRWVSIGAGAHPPPRNEGRGAKKAVTGPAVAAVPTRAPPVRAPSVPTAGVVPEGDERTASVSPDPELSRVAKLLAERSASFGRYYAVIGMKREDRARLVQGAEVEGGCSVSVEGEGRQRRVLFTPAKPSPIPKSAFPIDDDDDLGDD